MLILELSCLAIVLTYLLFRFRREPARAKLLRRIALLTAASWLCEDTAIRAYGFYQYSPRWSLFVDHVPLMILLIWPIVIISAWDLVSAIAGGRRRGALVIASTAAMVFIDAYLMEPIAVQSGLWSWNEPGVFDVPPIGVLGWSFFTASALIVFGWVDRSERTGANDLLILIASPILVHGALLSTWWGALRWVNGPIPDTVSVAASWITATGLAVAAWVHPAAARVIRGDLLLRVPAAGFFFVLLALNHGGELSLVAYAAAFSAPYLVLTYRARGSRGLANR